MTTPQDHNAQVTLKMFGMLLAADLGGCEVVGKVLPEIQV